MSATMLNTLNADTLQQCFVAGGDGMPFQNQHQHQQHQHQPHQHQNQDQHRSHPQQQQPQPQLRDSCRACADSKVKCSKDKPTCTRCARRGMPCQYEPSKRILKSSSSNANSRSKRQAPSPPETIAGRSPEESRSRHDRLASVSATAPGQDDLWSTLLSTAGSVAALGTSAHQSPIPAPPPSMAWTPLNFDHVGPHDDPVSALDFPAIVDDFAFWDRVLEDAPNHVNTSHLPQPFETVQHQDDLPIQNAMPAERIQTIATPGPSVRSSITSAPIEGFAAGNSQQQQPSPSPSLVGLSSSSNKDGCFPLALRLHQELLQSGAQTCNRQHRPSGGSQAHSTNTGGGPPVLKDVLAKNKWVVETVNGMLDCPCSNDVQLLMCIALVISRVIAWYADPTHGGGGDLNGQFHQQQQQQQQQQTEDEAMQSMMDLDQNQPPASSTSSSSIASSPHHHQEIENRIAAARLVLAELHQPQRLLNRFSKRFRELEEGDGFPKSSSSLMYERASANTGGSSKARSSGSTNSSFPLSILKMFEGSLRDHLRNVSLQTLSIVRES